MKIAICSTNNKPDSSISARLGRAPWIGVYDDAADKWAFLENSQNLNAMQGAGIQTSQNIINSGAQAVIAVNAGPKAMRALQSQNIAVYQAPQSVNLSECIELYKQNSLQQLSGANVGGHWV